MGRKRSGEYKKCKICGKVYYVKPFRKTSKYCSLDCYWKETNHPNKGKKPWLGKHHTTKTKQKISKALMGHKIFNREKSSKGWFKDGDIPHNKGNKKQSSTRLLRGNGKYKQWVKKIRERDVCCTICGSMKKLQADHIKPIGKYPELAYVLENGRLLCKRCHIKTDTYGGHTNA